MGIYLNPGNVNFRGFLKAEIYVDKTMMIEVMNRFIDVEKKYICASRPRRFGKTVTGNMLCAYYSKGCDSHELFDSLKISGTPGYEDKLNKYNVINIDMNSEYQNSRDKKNLIRNLEEDINEEFETAFPEVRFRKGDSLAKAIQKVYSATGETFIILIDEYDVLVREQVPQELFDEFLSFLNGLFKSDTLRPAISLTYLTGILPVVRDKVQSKLNNFEEYTILDAGELAEYVGFTSDEVETLCGEYGMEFAECRRWYDGYSQYGYEIYNPESVVKTMLRKEYDDYWGKTSTYQVIAEQIRRNFRGVRDDVVRMLAGEDVKVDTGMYLNTMSDFYSRDDVFAYLIYTGYLAYDRTTKTCRIPNREISLEWMRAVSVLDDYTVTDKIIKESEDLLQATIDGDEETAARALDESHIHVTSNRSYNNEDALQSAIYLAYIYALNKYTVIKEMTTGKGFADVAFIPFVPDIPAMIIELKHNKCAESALDQIKEKKYFDSLKDYKGGLLFVGLNYDEKDKTHECRIERFVKA
ncbi:MAG: AAA family ATPase [Lachnospiraceae bacterium]|nr:AAA family ATPase [Lachnospiraceae bacterium]